MAEKRRLRRSTVQDHFQYRKLVSAMMAPPQEDDTMREFYVEDSRGKVLKASSNEYYVALALKQLGLQFQFQLSVAGGRSLAFGIVLDFLVETAPLPTPVWVHGEYWHMGDRRAKDLRQQDIVREYMKGSILEPVELWGAETSTEERALAAVRRALR
jgi:hypothetical protein